MQMPERDPEFPGARVTGGCELLDRGAENQTPVLCKNSLTVELSLAPCFVLEAESYVAAQAGVALTI